MPFKPLKSQDLIDTLGHTIKHDDCNKLVTFLCLLTVYTDNSQFNISFNAPSSTGKSYIPTEIAKLFPEEDVMELSFCSPSAFFHDVGKQDKEKKGEIIVDLSKKIIIFLDQPHTQLLERLRPLLSHDKKIIKSKITDKSQKQGLRTKNITMIGYPSVVFCTAGLRLDEQEATRFLLLSPEVNQEKIREGVTKTIEKEVDNDAYFIWLESNPERVLLKERILAIRLENIGEIRISNKEYIIEKFFENTKILKPRHNRDIKRFISLIKAFALLNLWWREKEDGVIIANKDDIDEAFALWSKISLSQDLNLPPYIYNLYNEIIVPLWKEKESQKSDDEDLNEVVGHGGIRRKELLDKHYDVYGRMLDAFVLRTQIIPMLETAGLIMQEPDPSDKRQKLIFPTAMSLDDKYDTEKKELEEMVRAVGL